jgi:hypothetical protein
MLVPPLKSDPALGAGAPVRRHVGSMGLSVLLLGAMWPKNRPDLQMAIRVAMGRAGGNALSSLSFQKVDVHKSTQNLKPLRHVKFSV